MARHLGIDYGRRRIGLAISDSAGRLASPSGTLPSAGEPSIDARNVVDWADREGVEAYVVGLPLNMDGTEGPQARLSRRFADALQEASGGKSVVMWDERLSSFAADQVLDGTHLSRGKRAKHRDRIAAQIILQSYLDARTRPHSNGGAA